MDGTQCDGCHGHSKMDMTRAYQHSGWFENQSAAVCTTRSRIVGMLNGLRSTSGLGCKPAVQVAVDSFDVSALAPLRPATVRRRSVRVSESLFLHTRRSAISFAGFVA